METERRVDPGDEPVAINVAKTPNACGTGGRFELLQCCKSLIMDTSGSNGHLSLDFVIRGSWFCPVWIRTEAVPTPNDFRRVRG